MLQSDRSISENGGVSKEKVVFRVYIFPAISSLFVNALCTQEDQMEVDGLLRKS